jgi:hypothetical protein
MCWLDECGKWKENCKIKLYNFGKEPLCFVAILVVVVVYVASMAIDPSNILSSTGLMQAYWCKCEGIESRYHQLKIRLVEVN